MNVPASVSSEAGGLEKLRLLAGNRLNRGHVSGRASGKDLDAAVSRALQVGNVDIGVGIQGYTGGLVRIKRRNVDVIARIQRDARRFDELRVRAGRISSNDLR